MSSDFTIEFRDDHVHVELGPRYEITPENQEEFWRKVREVCDGHESRRVLVEGFVPGGERDTADVAEAGQRTAAVPNLWLAFRLEDFEPNDRSELFTAIAASNGVRVRFFSETAKALNWLRLNSPK